MDRININTKEVLTIMKHKLQMMKMRWLGAAVVLTLYTSSSWAFGIDDVAKQNSILSREGYGAPKSNALRFSRHEICGLSTDPVQSR